MPSEAGAGQRRLTLVAAYADNRVIGDRGRIPWHLPEDFAHFKALTLGHTLVMGRLTHESIGRPLPGRRTIVVTRDRGWRDEGVEVAHGLTEALILAADDEVYVAGGAQVYALAMPLATHQVLTEVHLSPEGDAFYPHVDPGEWHETSRVTRPGLDWVWLERVGHRPAPADILGT